MEEKKEYKYKAIDEGYKNYLKDCIKDAENLSIEMLGSSDNKTIAVLLDKIAQPYYYWKRA